MSKWQMKKINNKKFKNGRGLKIKHKKANFFKFHHNFLMHAYIDFSQFYAISYKNNKTKKKIVFRFPNQTIYS